jgi:hypothetical protein
LIQRNDDGPESGLCLILRTSFFPGHHAKLPDAPEPAREHLFQPVMSWSGRLDSNQRPARKAETVGFPLM